MDEIKNILKRIRPDGDFESSLHFVKEQLLDSLDIMEVVMSIEKQFKVDVPVDRIVPENFRSFAAIESLVRELKK